MRIHMKVYHIPIIVTTYGVLIQDVGELSNLPLFCYNKTNRQKHEETG